MPNGVEDLAEGSAPRRQAIVHQQGSTNVDLALAVAGTARGKGSIKRLYGGNMILALAGNATHDLMIYRYPVGCLLASAATTRIPLTTAPGIRLESTNLAGVLEELTALAESEVVDVLQAPGGANQIKLSAGASAVNGFWCDAEVYVLSGTGAGQKNRLTSYDGATKIAKVLNAEGSKNWAVATDATSVVRLRTRRYVVEKDDVIYVAHDFTIGTGTAGEDARAGVEVEYDDSVDV